MFFHGNQHKWAIKYNFIHLYSKYQSLKYICFPVMRRALKAESSFENEGSKLLDHSRQNRTWVVCKLNCPFLPEWFLDLLQKQSFLGLYFDLICITLFFFKSPVDTMYNFRIFRNLKIKILQKYWFLFLIIIIIFS